MIKNNGDPEIKQKCSEWYKNDGYYIGPHKVRIEFRGENAVVKMYHGALYFTHGDIKVKKTQFNLFGLTKIKPFEERLQNAVDKMQIRCDEYDRTELREKELNQKYHT